jgi:DNA-binding PadR family transcriptional regulator
MGRYSWGCNAPGGGAWGFGWGYAPWAKRGRFFEAGEVRIAILSLLSEGPKHGYELMKALEERSGGVYKVSAGTMYPALAQLEDEGMIVSEQKDGRRIYRLTDLGKKELDSEKSTADRIWRRASQWEDWGQWMGPGVAMISASLAALIKSAFRAMKHAADDPEHRRRVEDILDHARKELDEL